jgi:DivIVA domain-containing protein
VTTQIDGAYPPDAQWSMPVTPEQLRTVEFGRAPFGRRGYHEEEVHRFLSRVAEDVSNSDAEKARLRAEIDRLRNYFRKAGVNLDDRSSRPAPSTDAVMVMSRAQQAADAQIARAEEYARQLVAEARKRYEAVLVEAQRQAAQAAEQAAVALRERTHDTSDEQQEYLARRVAYLRTFAEVTQIQLKSTLEALAREVDKLGRLPGEHATNGGYGNTEPVPRYDNGEPAPSPGTQAVSP